MVGRLPDAHMAGRLGFARAGESIALAGPFTPSLAASELAKLRGEPLPDRLPGADIDALARTHSAVRDAVRAGALSSAHDIAEGGLAVALAECALASALGAQVELDGAFPGAPLFETLFGEGPGGFVLSGPRDALEALAQDGAPLLPIGVVGGEELRIELCGEVLAATLAELADAHGALRELFR